MKNIERACRTCYRSENLISDESYKNLLPIDIDIDAKHKNNEKNKG